MGRPDPVVDYNTSFNTELPIALRRKGRNSAMGNLTNISTSNPASSAANGHATSTSTTTHPASLPASELPLALRRARRASGLVAHSNSPLNNTSNGLSKPAGMDTSLHPTPQTPKKTKKRARHSDPLPLTEQIISSGLTQRVKRVKLGRPATTPGRETAGSRRRTLPARLLSDTADIEPEARPMEVQFFPIRQALTPRVQRRMKRRGFSEEQNKVEDERKTIAKQQARIAQLEAELAAAKDEAEAATRAQQPSASFQRVEELQAELSNVNEQLEQSMSPPTQTPFQTLPMKEWPENPFVGPASPASTVPFSDDEGEDFAMPMSPPSDGQRSPSPSPTPANRLSIHHVGLQTDLSSSKLLSIETSVAEQTQYLIAARRELEDIMPGETALPLTPTHDANVSPLVTALLQHLRNTKSSLAQKQASLATIERQEKNLRAQFNASLAQIDTARSNVQQLQSALDKTTAVFRASRRQADDYYQQKKLAEGKHRDAEDKAQDAESKLKDAEEKLAAMESSAEQQQLGTERLSTALTRCYGELETYQALILQVEEKHGRELERMQAEHLAAVTDLEAQLEAAIRIRADDDDEGERERVQLRSALQQNQWDTNELREAIHLKQQLLRDVEARLETEQQAREHEVGGLNVQLAQTESRVAELEEKVQAEKRRARAAIRQLALGVKDAAEQAIRDTRSQPSRNESFGSGGLLTPVVEGGRTRDVLTEHMMSDHAEGEVQGVVEMQRGKSARRSKSSRRQHPDSGIGIPEEDEGVDHLLSSEL